MATLTLNQQLTMIELAKREFGGRTLQIAEVLVEDNEILYDAVWAEANSKYSNVTTQRYSEPAGQWRSINAGVTKSASQTKQIVDQIGMLDDRAEIDIELIKIAKDPATFQNGEVTAFMNGMGKTIASAIIYGNALTDPEKFTGLAPRLASLNSNNVFGCSGTGSDLTSVFIVQWGLDKVHCIYPEGSQIGLDHKQFGSLDAPILVDDPNDATKKFPAVAHYFSWKCGLVVRNPRCIGRVCNIETSGTTNILDVDKLIGVLNRMYNRGAGATIYCNATVFDYLDIEAKDKANVWYTKEDVWGRPTTFFRGLPVRKVDKIINTETALT